MKCVMICVMLFVSTSDKHHWADLTRRGNRPGPGRCGVLGAPCWRTEHEQSEGPFSFIDVSLFLWWRNLIQPKPNWIELWWWISVQSYCMLLNLFQQQKHISILLFLMSIVTAILEPMLWLSGWCRAAPFQTCRLKCNNWITPYCCCQLLSVSDKSFYVCKMIWSMW